MRNQEARIIALERGLPRGCQVCTWWSSVECTAVDDRGLALPDSLATRPEVCPNCGRHVPIRLRRTIVVIGDPESVEAAT